MCNTSLRSGSISATPPSTSRCTTLVRSPTPPAFTIGPRSCSFSICLDTQGGLGSGGSGVLTHIERSDTLHSHRTLSVQTPNPLPTPAPPPPSVSFTRSSFPCFPSSFFPCPPRLSCPDLPASGVTCCRPSSCRKPALRVGLARGPYVRAWRAGGRARFAHLRHAAWARNMLS